MSYPSPLSPHAAALRQSVKQQLAAPAAMLVPAPIRRTLDDLADLLVLLAFRVDSFPPPPPKD